jgi:trehalose/maltose transport system permease protein
VIRTIPQAQAESSKYTFGFTAIAVLLLVLAVGTAVFYAQSIFTLPTVQQGLNGEVSLVLALLNDVGIILPVLVIFFAIYLLITAVQILRGSPEAIRWAGVIVFWLTVGAFGLGVFMLIQQSAGNALLSIPTDWGRGLRAGGPFLLVAIPTAIATWWMGRHGDYIARNQTITARSTRMAWNLLIPTIAILIIVAARPLEQTFITSLTDKRFGSADPVHFVGVQNYTNLLSFRFDTVECRRADDGSCVLDASGGVRWALIDRELLQAGYRSIAYIPIGGDRALTLSGTDSDFLTGIGNTLYFTVVSVSLELLFGLFIAMVVNSEFKGRGVMRAVMLVPWAIPTVISARLWELMLRDNQSGIVNKFLIDIGVLAQSQAWLTNSTLQIPALIMVDVWKTTPFMALLLLAGLQLIPADLYEAASVDGANRWTQFTRITLPLLRPVIGIALIFRTLDALRVFDVFNVLLGRQKLSMATYNYEKLIQEQQGGYASSVSVIIFILIAVFTFLYVRSVKIETT